MIENHPMIHDLSRAIDYCHYLYHKKKEVKEEKSKKKIKKKEKEKKTPTPTPSPRFTDTHFCINIYERNRSPHFLGKSGLYLFSQHFPWNSIGIPSFPGVLLFLKLSKSKAHSSGVIFPSHEIFRSSENLGIFKSL